VSSKWCQFIVAFFTLLAAACTNERPTGGEEAPASAQGPPAAKSTEKGQDEGGAPAEPSANFQRLLEPRFSNFDEMVERRVIRVLVTHSKTHFFLDGGRQRGIVADALLELEKVLNEELELGARKLHLAAIPVNRNDLIPFLEQGRGDFAAAGLTITPERLERLDFTVPTWDGVNELIVTGPGAPALQSLDDLSGKTVYVRRSSSFFTSLERINASFEARGLEPVEIVPASEYLETEDLLEMTNAGLVPITIADSHIAHFWDQVLDNIVVHDDLAVATSGEIAWALRKSATGLKAHLDPWIEANSQGQLLGNMLLKRYLKSTKYVKNALADEDRERFKEKAGLFEKYAEQYDFEWLMVVAQAYQESGLDQSRRSHVGAIGVMQLMPATANDPAVGIPNVEELEPNIHAGNKYLRHLVDQYFNDPGIDAENRLLFAFAGYNAGPNRINRLRKVADDEGFDPNQWFRNVEMVVAREVGREPVHYVANIYKYYLAYSMIRSRDQ
jgi:membrane-bound lytic murein transglycosylase MltF